MPTMDPTLEELRFPLGRFEMPPDPVAASGAGIERIAALPAELREAVAALSNEQLDTPYRPDGWTLRQVIHHIADSHLNSYLRFKLAATEERPRVRLYDEALWAELEDGRLGPVEASLALLESLHQRWVIFLRSLDADGLSRTFVHPDYGELTVAQNIAIYAWHGRHHLGHITSLSQRRGWV